MRFRTLWGHAALYAFYRLPIHSATIVDRAVIRFAELGEGDLALEPPYYRLRAGVHDALLTIDGASLTLTVHRIRRARP